MSDLFNTEKTSNTSSLIVEIASDDEMNALIKEKTVDLWVGTPFEGYVHMNNKNKGVYGEIFGTKYLTEIGFKCEKRLNAGHDEVVNGIKTEKKFSLATTDNKKLKILDDSFVLNHVAINKDWERLIFFGINSAPNFTPRIFWFSKEDFVYLLETKLFFGRQQGGKDGDNDDYMCSGEDLKKLMGTKYARSLMDW